MKKKLYFTILCYLILIMANSCQGEEKQYTYNKKHETMDNTWKQTLEQRLPLLGHRNWIIITDMAYPQQTSSGITTLYAPDPYEQVASDVFNLIKDAPHIFPHIYLDKEQQKLSETLCKGWDNYQILLKGIIKDSPVSYISHEELIKKLDIASQSFQVIIIKTPLTLPYSSIFLEMDCKYWDATREKKLRERGE